MIKCKFNFKGTKKEKRKTLIFIIGNITSYFENLTVKLQILYILNNHVNFHVNWILFTI